MLHRLKYCTVNNVTKSIIAFHQTGKKIASLVLISIIYRFYCSLMDNAELLKRRLKSLEDSKEQVDESLKQQIAYSRTLEREMYKLKSEIGHLARQRDRHLAYVCFLFLSFLPLLLFLSTHSLLLKNIY